MNQAQSPAWDRLLRQQLSSLASAGLTHLAKGQTATAAGIAVTPAISPSPAPVPLTSPLSETAMPRAKPKSSPAPAKGSLIPESSTTVASHRGTPLSRDERVAQLSILSDKVAGCTRCSELAATRQRTVFGVGNPEPKIVFIGEAPGADEDRQGEPFVGRAGQLLTKIIEACRLKREDIYICNILKCRPPENRPPEPPECVNCREYLDGQLAILDPDYIVCWGTVAARNLLGSEETIGKMRGKFFQHGRAKVLCTYHPSYLLRNPPAKKDVWEDMKFFFNDMGVKLS